MKRKEPAQKSLPSIPQLKAELRREKYKKRFRSVMRSTIYTLIVVAAIAVLVATIWMPVLQIYGSSMTPTLHADEIVVTVTGTDFQPGDLLAFYYGNQLLVKRYIAGPGQWVDIDQDGNVFVDGVLLDEPYVNEKAFGDCNIELPYQVPENRYFVMGDHREQSKDSRLSEMGAIKNDDIVGKIVFRVWPLESFGPLNLEKVGDAQ